MLVVFVAVQQIEGHVLVPNIMGTTVGVHPLVVIFALLMGAQMAGIIGMLAVLPILAILRHTLDFYDIRLSRAAWIADDGIALPAPPERRARPAPAGAPRTRSGEEDGRCRVRRLIADLRARAEAIELMR